MAGLSRKFGSVGFVLSVGVACTQLFGGEQNTLAPQQKGQTPTVSTPTLEPRASGPATICETGQMRCEGAQLQTCADDRASWVTVQRCGAAALCQVNPASCLQATCSAEEMTCSGAILQKCNADRTGWDLFATCLSPAHCNADLRQCMTEPCSPGDRRCDRSDSDQSPVLEVCRDDRADWAPLDACVTRELCDQTLTTGSNGGLVLGSDGMVQVQAPTTPDTVVKCSLPACAVGEVRCDGARLEYCSEGRTGWITAEECASAALCSGSLTNVGSAGVPQCLTATCAVGEHRCTETGVLQLCSEDRTGFRDIETCIGAPFCNAVLADQGQAGCRDAPCEAGQMQCNGAQIQVCREDRTALDDVGPPCESAALCNASDPFNAVCDPPVCHRGATSGDEFHCEGAELQRCNESLTVYDTIQTCVTPALCDASQRFDGCKAPTCQPGEPNCDNGFLQTCNADQNGFNNVENCGSPAQCDESVGRCADPCEPGATRCNATTGDLEQCRDRLTGWQPIADCQSLALCDAENGRCNICIGGGFSCADNQLRQCAADGRTFSRQNIPAECAIAANGGAGVRGCQNNQVVVNPCPLGCTNGRCHECSGTQTQCVGNGQIRRCVNGFFGNPTSCSDGNACNGAESCQNNNCVAGQALTCNDNNQCTNDSCNPTVGCQFAGFSNNFQCINNGGQVQGCSNGQLQTANCTGLGCTAGRCNNCSQGACANGTQFQTCDNGQLSAAKTCPAGQVCQGSGNCVFNCQQLSCTDNNPCTNDTCNATAGCQFPPVANRSQCVNGDIQSCTNGNSSTLDCGAAGCNANSTSCNACAAGTAPTCLPNGQRRTCVNGQFQDAPCATGTTCQNGACAAPPPTCTTGTCSGNVFTPCVNGQPGTPRTCTPNQQICSAAAQDCVNLACTVGQLRCNNGALQECRADRTGFQPRANACEATTFLSCANATSTTVTRLECNRDTNPCTAEFCTGTGSGCSGTAVQQGLACTVGGRNGQCGNLDGVCHIPCSVRADCPLSTDVCSTATGECIAGCAVTGCPAGRLCQASGLCFTPA